MDQSNMNRELLALPDGPSVPVPEKRTQAYYAKRPCPDKVKSAAAILEDYLKGASPTNG